MAKKSNSKLAKTVKAKMKKQPPHVIVEALAGTGKTTTLIEGLREITGSRSKLTPSPQQKAVWDAIAESKGVQSIGFFAFNKGIASELQQRVPSGVDAMTMHSLGYKAILNYLGRLARQPNDYRTQDLLAEILQVDIREFRKEKDNWELIKGVEELVRLCKMNLIDPSAPDLYELLDGISSHHELELGTTQDKVFDLVPRVLELAKDVKRDRHIDFNDMIWLPVVLDLYTPTYDLVLVDEAQDLNRCQQALAKKIGKRLIFCGDKHQAIYGFAGADAESMERLANELAETEQGVIRLPLTMTRRCGHAIVEEAQKIVPEFEAHESNPPGRISTARYKGPKGSVFPIVVDGEPVDEASDRSKTSYHCLVKDGDMLVCRVNAPLISQCFKFLRAGRRAEIQGRDIGAGLVKLIKKFKAEKTEELVGQLSDWVHQERTTEQAKRIPNEAKLIALQDKYECLLMFCEDTKLVEQVIDKIQSVFTDDRHTKGIKLSSIHKAKGLEANNVFLLEPKGATVPHPMAKSEWQRVQEWNLRYVAITRAIHELVYVTEGEET